MIATRHAGLLQGQVVDRYPHLITGRAHDTLEEGQLALLLLNLGLLILEHLLQLFEGRLLGSQQGVLDPQIRLELCNGLALSLQRLLLHRHQAALCKLLPIPDEIPDARPHCQHHQ